MNVRKSKHIKQLTTNNIHVETYVIYQLCLFVVVIATIQIVNKNMYRQKSIEIS